MKNDNKDIDWAIYNKLLKEIEQKNIYPSLSTKYKMKELAKYLVQTGKAFQDLTKDELQKFNI